VSTSLSPTSTSAGSRPSPRQPSRGAHRCRQPVPRGSWRARHRPTEAIHHARRRSPRGPAGVTISERGRRRGPLKDPLVPPHEAESLYPSADRLGSRRTLLGSYERTRASRRSPLGGLGVDADGGNWSRPGRARSLMLIVRASVPLPWVTGGFRGHLRGPANRMRAEKSPLPWVFPFTPGHGDGCPRRGNAQSGRDRSPAFCAQRTAVLASLQEEPRLV
jgi:hypothetical protein